MNTTMIQELVVTRRANVADAVLRVGDSDALELVVLSYEGEEALGGLFRFSIDVSIEEVLADSVTEISFVGERAALRLTDEEGRTRCIRGVIREGEFLRISHSHVHYRLHLSPPAWMLTQRVNSRVFQELSTPEIIAAVLADHGLGGDAVHFALKEHYRARDYCVQYRESDWDFVSRLMEEEGMYHFQRERDGVQTLHITDGSHGHFDLEFGAQTRFHAPEGLASDPGTVHRLAFHRRVRPGAVAQTDYAAMRPSMPLVVRAQADGVPAERGLEVFDFPGEYRDKDLGQRLSRVRLEELRTDHFDARGGSTRVDFAPGRRLSLCEHRLARFNGEFVITRVAHRGWSPMAESTFAAPHDGGGVRRSYENEFHVIPADQPFRPARTTPRPRVGGPQTAVVVGPEGEEIYTDKHGRVKVRFRWDRPEQLGRDTRRASDSSCWIRVSQPWAGLGYGGIAIPRIGQEVVVDFLEGDPDQPIITGRVYNGEAQAPQSMSAPMRMTGKGAEPIPAMQGRPQTLPAAATRTTIRSNSTPGGGGANEFSMDDAAGAELFHLNATKDFVRTVGNDDTLTVGNNRKISIGNNLEEFVGVNRDRHVGANETVAVKANQGVTVDANRSITVKANESHTVNMCRAKQTMISENIMTGVSKTVETGLAHIETVGLLHTLIVGMQRLTAVGMNDDLIVGADKCDKIYGNYTTTVDNEMGISVGAKLVVECPDITLASKGGFIRIDGDGVTIKGTKVKINCSGAEAGKLSGTSTAAGGGGASGSSGTNGSASGIVAGGCTPGGAAQGGLGGLLDSLGLGGFDGLLTELGIDPQGPLGQVLGAVGEILPKIPGVDPNIGNLLNTLLNNGVPSMEEIFGAVRNRLPEDAQKALDAIIAAIRRGTNPPPLPGRPTNPALPGGQAQTGGNGTVSNFGPDGAGGAPAADTGAPSSGGTQGSFNAAAAASHASANAESAPTGMCGQYVREAIAAGGVTVQPTGSAMNYGPNLVAAGFQAVPATEGSYVPQQGDVVVFQATDGHPHGHIQIHDGSQFVSDFKQNDPLWPSSNPNSSWQQNKPSFTVYRYPAS